MPARIRAYGLDAFEKISSMNIPPWRKAEKFYFISQRAFQKAYTMDDVGKRNTLLDLGAMFQAEAENLEFHPDTKTITRWNVGNRMEDNNEHEAELCLPLDRALVGDDDQIDKVWERTFNPIDDDWIDLTLAKPHLMPREQQFRTAQELVDNIRTISSYPEALVYQVEMAKMWTYGLFDWDIWSVVRDYLSKYVIQRFSNLGNLEASPRWRSFEPQRPKSSKDIKAWQQYVRALDKFEMAQQTIRNILTQQYEPEPDWEEPYYASWAEEEWQPSKPLEPAVTHMMISQDEMSDLKPAGRDIASYFRMNDVQILEWMRR